MGPFEAEKAGEGTLRRVNFRNEENGAGDQKTSPRLLWAGRMGEADMTIIRRLRIIFSLR